MEMITGLDMIAAKEAARRATPVAVVCQGRVALGLPDGATVEMPASIARDAATALLGVCDDEGAGGRSCVACRHALVCSQLSRIRHALTLRDYLCDGGEDLILQAVAGSCQLFEVDAVEVDAGF